jgi:hypothetical protein
MSEDDTEDESLGKNNQECEEEEQGNICTLFYLFLICPFVNY